MNDKITHVSDTALWVAAYRADETAKPNALFRDPLAEVLVGERGHTIAKYMPYPQIMSWVLVIRTLAIDRLIEHAIKLGIDTVLNLGAGLDTRPYRMNLPKELRWVEVDFSQIIEYKNSKLKNEKPICRLERIATDLSNTSARRKLFSDVGSNSKKVLIITEGVIPYLTCADAKVLSLDLFATPPFHFWIQDYRQGGLKQWAPRRMRKALKDSPFKFDTPDWLSFFRQQGWVIAENILATDEARRVSRPFPFYFPWNLLIHILPRSAKVKWQKAAGYVMYQKPTKLI
jgi:methyltransferase (TIGR00027 family)